MNLKQWLFGLSISLAACSTPAQAVAPVIVTATPSPTLPPAAVTTVPLLPSLAPTAGLSATVGEIATPTPTAPVTPTPAATPTPACAEPAGAVIRDEIDSPATEQIIRLRIYLPPCYAAETWRAYPVLYLLHGLRMNETTWEQLGADETANALITKGEIPPLIMVMPRVPDVEQFAEAVALELVPYIDAHYRTLPDREHRAVGGMSRGSGWTVRIGLQYPELFSALGLHSLAIFYADEDKVWRWLNALPDDQLLRIYLDIGNQDPEVEAARWFDQALTARQIDHQFLVNPGAHTAAFWTKHLPEYLRWYAATW